MYTCVADCLQLLRNLFWYAMVDLFATYYIARLVTDIYNRTRAYIQ